jgi:DNA end-binding protein Ku
LVLNTLFYPDEIRIERGKPLPEVPISDKEMMMAGTLVDLMTHEFNAAEYTDSYRDAVLKTIEAKLEGREVADAPAAAPGKVIDLMEALQASMESLKAKQEEKKETLAVAASETKKPRKKAAAG